MKRLLISRTLLLTLLWTGLGSTPASVQAKGAKDPFLVRTASGSDRAVCCLLAKSLVRAPENDNDPFPVRTASGSDRVVCSLLNSSLIRASVNDFDAVVKLVEEFYGVKHQGIPFLAKAGIKAATTVARIAGGSKKRLAEAGSVKVAFFDGQELKAKSGISDFRAALKGTLLGGWLPFIQVLSLNEGAQTYVFLRDAGPKYTVLVVTIEEHDAAVIQVNLAPQTLARLMQNPNEMGKAITDDATNTDDQE